MKTIISATIALLAITGLAAFSDTQTVSLQAQQTPVKDAMEQISKQVGLQIICDTGVSGTVNGSFSSMELEKFLDTVTKGGDLKWQKIYLPPNPDKKPTLDQIKTQMRTLKAVGEQSIVVYDPITKQQTVYVKQSVEAAKLPTDSLGLTPVYLITSIKAEAEAAKVQAAVAAGATLDPKVVAQLQSLDSQRKSVLLQLPADQRVQALQQQMISDMNSDPATQAAIMKAQWDARQQMPQELQTQYRQYMRTVMQSVNPGGGWRGGGGGGGRRGNGTPAP
jgi:hypothetical protein